MSGDRFRLSDPDVPIPSYIGIVWDSVECRHMNQSDVIGLLNLLVEKNEELRRNERKPLTDDEIRRLYGRLMEKEYRKHCQGNHTYTLDTSDVKVRF